MKAFLLPFAFLYSVSLATAEMPEWARGWIVASVIIPVNGEIKDAFVDLQTPDGKLVILTAGTGAEGVSLRSVAWEGTPVRAHIRLEKGGAGADFFAHAALVAKSKVQKKVAGRVQIESRFIEVPEALARTLKNPAGQLLFPPAGAGNRDQPVGGGQTVSILKGGELQAFVARVNKLKGVNLLGAPSVTTKSKQRAVIEIIREFVYAVEWEPDTAIKGGWIPSAFETRNVGVTLEVEPAVGKDNTLDLRLIPQQVEYLGAVDVETGKAIKAPPVPVKGDENGVPPAVPFPNAAGRRLRPVFSHLQVTTDVTIFSGTSVILGGLSEMEDTKLFKPKTPGRRLIVIVTAKTLDN